MPESDLRVSFSIDAQGRLLSGEQPAVERSGYDSPKGVRLTIDKRIQTLAEDSLSHSSIERGAVVVLEAATGKIRAMASCLRLTQMILPKASTMRIPPH